MKKKKLVVLLCCCALLFCLAGAGEVFAVTDGVSINAANFPDEYFRAYVKKTLDQNHDNSLSQSEREAVTKIHLSNSVDESMEDLGNSRTVNLEGIGTFPNLNQLIVDPSAKLDLRKNYKLVEIHVNEISAQGTPRLGFQPELRSLIINDDALPNRCSLDLRGCPKLVKLVKTGNQTTDDKYVYYSSSGARLKVARGTSILTKDIFSDVPAGKYYHYPVLWAYYHDPQITGGTDATHFSPGKDCTREQIVTFLWKSAGAPEPSTARNPFKDVKSDKYYYKAVLWAVEAGITSGTTATTFGVGELCKREQAMTFLWKANGSPSPKHANNPFKDVKSDKYYYTAILWAVEEGITSGTTATTFGVGETCTRGQIVTFLYAANGPRG